MAKKEAVKKVTDVVNVMDLLGAQAVKTEKVSKKKDDMPILTLEDTEKNKRVIDNWIKFKREETSAANNKKKEEETLKAMITDARIKHSLATRTQSKSVKIKVGEDQPDSAEGDKIVKGRKSEIITASFQDKISKIALTTKTDLEKIFGSDYTKFFKMITNIQLTEAAMNQVEVDSAAGKPTVLNKIMDALGGPQEFFKVFAVSQGIEARDALFETYPVDGDVNLKVKKATNDGVLKLQAPSLSV